MWFFFLYKYLRKGYFAESPQQRNQEFGCCTDALLHVGVLMSVVLYDL